MSENKKNKEENTGPLISQDVPTTFEYLNKPIKPKKPKPKKGGIFLEDKYAKLIRKRKKREIVSTEYYKNYIGKEIFFCGDYIYGSIILNEPIKVDRELLKNHSKRHLMSDYDINKRWSNEQNFYSYSFRIVNVFKSPRKYYGFKNKNFGIVDDIEYVERKEKMRDLPNLNREHDDKISADREQKYKVEPGKEEKIEYNSNTILDKYYKTIDEFKSIDFSAKYKDIAKLFLGLFELYLEKTKGKIYDKDGVVLKPAPDITENYIRVRIRDPKTIVEGSFRTITISESQGIKAVIGKLKKDPTGPTKVQSVLFDKEKWTSSEAMKWVEEHREDLKSLMAEDFKENNEDNKSPKKLIVEEKTRTYEIWICPHCNKEIGEKELYCDKDGNDFHRPCIEKGPIELPKDDRVLFLTENKSLQKRAETYIDDGYIQRDKDKGKSEEKWVRCKKCKKSFDYYKQLLDNKSTLLCPHCGALVIFEED